MVSPISSCEWGKLIVMAEDDSKLIFSTGNVEVMLTGCRKEEEEIVRSAPSV